MSISISNVKIGNRKMLNNTAFQTEVKYLIYSIKKNNNLK